MDTLEKKEAPQKEEVPTKSLDNSNKLMMKEQGFDRGMRSLIKELEEVINERYGSSEEYGVRDELLFLRKYLSVYDRTKPEEHYQYFEALFGRKRPDILKSLDDDSWLRNGRVVIQFGELIKNNPELEERRKQLCIMLSQIFNIAIDLQTKAEEMLETVGESLVQTSNKDLIRPNILLLHLFRIFYYLNEGRDKQQLGIILTKLEDELGIKKKTVDLFKETPIPSATGSGASAIGGLYTMAAELMGKFGFAPPADMVPPTEEQIGTVMNSVFSNETTQAAIGNMVASLKDCTDLGSSIQTIMKTVGDPATIEAFQGTINETVKSAMENKVPPK